MRIDRHRLAALLGAERRRFTEANGASLALFERAKTSLHGGVPMPWMTQWASPFPLFIEGGKGCYLRDADGHSYIDFCLGDTGALFGHSPTPVAEARAERAADGMTFMLPNRDAIHVGEALTARFGLPHWQFALSATDANRFAIKIARVVTDRRRVLLFNGCYHGGLDETLATLENGVMRADPTNMGPGIEVAETSRMVEFNDIAAVEAALAEGDVACVLCEPALTNCGLVFPREGFHEALRAATRASGVMLIIDEAHSICAGPGGGVAEYGLDPDLITLGKPVAGGVPAAVYGYSAAVGERITAWLDGLDSFVTGIGGTLAGNALAMAAIRATLDHVMTEAAYDHMTTQAMRLEVGVAEIIAGYGLPWSVARLGARVEYRWGGGEPANATEALSDADPELDRLFRLFFLNRGIMLTIFYNVALVSPATSAADIDRHNAVFDEFCQAVTGLSYTNLR